MTSKPTKKYLKNSIFFSVLTNIISSKYNYNYVHRVRATFFVFYEQETYKISFLVGTYSTSRVTVTVPLPVQNVDNTVR